MYGAERTLRRSHNAIIESPANARSWFGEMAMELTEPIWWMTKPICSCVEVSQNETDEFAEAAMNAPLLDREMHVGLLVL